MRYQWAARSDVGQVRHQNEDSVLPGPGTAGSDEHLVAAIADGMGGAAGGARAHASGQTGTYPLPTGYPAIPARDTQSHRWINRRPDHRAFGRRGGPADCRIDRRA